MGLFIDNNNQLILEFECIEERIAFTKSIPYKMRIKRFVSHELESCLFFKEDISIHEIKRVEGELRNKFPDIDIDNSVFDYINNRQFYIENRYRLGNDIKKQVVEVESSFNTFCHTIDAIMLRKLKIEQKWHAFYQLNMKNTSNFSVPGSGKTATVLGTYAYLKANNLANKIVMIGPKNAFGSWIDEFTICLPTETKRFYLNIHSKETNSVEKRKFSLKFDSGNKELILVNYESINSLKNELLEIIDNQTLLVFDEVHKIKNPEGQRADASKEISKNAGRIIALTGTPIPNSYVDIYNLLNMLYPEDYKDFFGFTKNELKKVDIDTMDEINEKIKPFFCRMNKDDLGVPKAEEDELLKVHATEAENQLFKIIKQSYQNNLFGLLVRVMQLESNPKKLLEKIDYSDLRGIIDDESYESADVEVVDYSEDVNVLIEQIKEPVKVKKTIELTERLVRENKPVIIWCTFVSSIKTLENRLSKKGIKVKCIYGEVELDERLKLIDDFKNRQFEVLITNPHTLAESVSLHMVCHDAIYFEYSFNLVHLLQSKDRIHRLGLKSNQYTQYYFLQQYYEYGGKEVSIGNKIYQRLKEKEVVMIEAINNDVLESVTSYEEDLELIFGEVLLI
ncbi:DEAD/DEAH box helicase [Enterococcus casseliflavus]|uniref:DEAD/DEAH box helicase n=1 Tax=Enterococcus casseliflavus TaxID=37734 RepID=UPI0022E29211|nr:DEAD/DEAH box helicase [Enterococcus casseliflavus]